MFIVLKSRLGRRGLSAASRSHPTIRHVVAYRNVRAALGVVHEHRCCARFHIVGVEAIKPDGRERGRSCCVAGVSDGFVTRHPYDRHCVVEVCTGLGVVAAVWRAAWAPVIRRPARLGRPPATQPLSPDLTAVSGSAPPPDLSRTTTPQPGFGRLGWSAEHSRTDGPRRQVGEAEDPGREAGC